VEELAIALAVLSASLLTMGFLYRRFGRAAPDVPRICHAAAAIALVIGIVNVITGVAHSVAVASLAFNEPEYGSLQVLRFTTGLMLVYSGAMAAALYRAIALGRGPAIAIAAAAALLFEIYLLFLLELPGTGGTVPPMLGGWTVYLMCLAAAGVTSIRNADRPRVSSDAHP